jgi:DnaD/phage-associated family protein
MNEEKTLLTAEEADKLLASADGTAALLYLHIRRAGGFSLTEAVRVLRRGEADVALAAETLRRLGLLPKPDQPLPDETLPQLTTRDLRDIASKDDSFRGLVAEAEKALGRVLSDNDLRVLFGIYDHMGLPADVILLLLNHCIDEYQFRSGPGRMPTMRYIEKEAWFWTGHEIVNLDAAEEHLRRCAERREAAEQAKEVLQIRGRSLGKSEREYIDGWLELGFGPEALAIAYDRTVLRTGRLTWKYMDTILRSWCDKGLLTPEEIEAKDPAKRSRAAAPAASNSEKMAQMEKMVAHMRKPGGGKER